MTSRLLPLAAVGLSLVVAAPAFALEPDPGDWSSSPVRGKGARAVVEFVVEGGTVSPAVEVTVRRCGRRMLELPSVPVAADAFKARVRERAGRAKVVLRLEGTFDSEFEAHGTVQGTVKLRRGRKTVTCKLPKLSWTAESALEETWTEEEEEYLPDEYDPEADEEYGPEDEVEYGEDDEGYPEDEYPSDEV